MRSLSVIIPAFNEELYLPRTLECLAEAIAYLGDDTGHQIEVVLVDNASTDRTAQIAASFGARIVAAPEHNIGCVRNVGAGASSGDVLVFLDADTLIPKELLSRILEVMGDAACLGGAVDIDYRPARTLIRAYLRAWRIIGLTLKMAQGATQFCRREAFTALNGYDETLYMGEDVDFYWRLRQLAKSRGHRVRFLRELRVVPSCRRFDRWPILRTLVETNPFYIALFHRRQSAWRGWYDDVPR
jgi:glycosyltransferase involved in cell wall biosynthesis